MVHLHGVDITGTVVLLYVILLLMGFQDKDNGGILCLEILHLPCR